MYVKPHFRRKRNGISYVKGHYQRKGLRKNFFFSKNGLFMGIGVSKKYGPYLTAGYKEGKFKVKTSIGSQGHKIGGSYKPTKNTEIGIERNLTFNKTKGNFRYKKNKFDFDLPS